ncbi:MAG: septum formation initiator family protein [Magnetococcales bacterium]|nr:septum formation initiator family protein [Magnetococcales bacterium]MBF0420323.1 septum formation initiator family protein [Magnetococcales bacterium]
MALERSKIEGDIDVTTPEKSNSAWVMAGLFLLTANGWAQYLLWFGDQGLVRWRQTKQQFLAVRQENREVEERLERLKEEISLLDKETVVFEEVARRDLGLVYPDDILFIDKNAPQAIKPTE